VREGKRGREEERKRGEDEQVREAEERRGSRCSGAGTVMHRGKERILELLYRVLLPQYEYYSKQTAMSMSRITIFLGSS
jgi:hypothetical protein